MPTESELDALRKEYATSLVRERSARIKRNLTLGDLLEWHKAAEQALEDGAVLNKRLLADNRDLRERLAAAEGALEGVDELAAEGVGEFSLSSAKRDFLDIRDVVSEVLHKHPATPPAADADASDGAERTE